jgi:hypothetical protein
MRSSRLLAAEFAGRPCWAMDFDAIEVIARILPTPVALGVPGALA